MQDEGDDPTVPTGRAGIDPLLAYPVESTGYTGQIERPGDQTPWWFIPGLFAVAVFFIGLLSLISQDRTADRVAAQDAADARVAAEQAEAAEQAAAVEQANAEQAASSVPVTEAAPAGTVAPLDDSGLPPAGSILVNGDQFAITARCEVQLPFDPANVTVQVSSYAYLDNDGLPRIIDRIVDGDNDSASISGSGAAFEGLDEIGDDGAFSARFEGGAEATVNPSSGSSQCNDSLITNAPGQFTEPFTRTILDICVDGNTTVGLASLGGRFEVTESTQRADTETDDPGNVENPENAEGPEAAGGGEFDASIVLQDPAGGVRRVSTEATVLRSNGVLSASGVVVTGNEVTADRAAGDEALDISIDVGFSLDLDVARECAPSERL